MALRWSISTFLFVGLSALLVVCLAVSSCFAARRALAGPLCAARSLLGGVLYGAGLKLAPSLLCAAAPRLRRPPARSPPPRLLPAWLPCPFLRAGPSAPSPRFSVWLLCRGLLLPWGFFLGLILLFLFGQPSDPADRLLVFKGAKRSSSRQADLLDKKRSFMLQPRHPCCIYLAIVYIFFLLYIPCIVLFMFSLCFCSMFCPLFCLVSSCKRMLFCFQLVPATILGSSLQGTSSQSFPSFKSYEGEFSPLSLSGACLPSSADHLLILMLRRGMSSSCFPGAPLTFPK